MRNNISSLCFGLLACFVALVASAPSSALQPRYNNILPWGGVSLIQWTTASTANNLRSYHIDENGNIIESSYDKARSGWSSVKINLGVTANAGGYITAGVHKISDTQVEIRLFFQTKDANGRNIMQSAIYTNIGGWKSDYQFNQDIGNADLEPHSVVTWTDSSGKTQWRLYYIKYQAVGFGSFDNQILEATFPAGPNGDIWAVGNGGNAVAISNAINGAGIFRLTAVAWKRGERISVFYFHPKAGEIHEARYQSGVGWKDMPQPSSDFSGFGKEGIKVALAAVGWVDANGDDQLRLYVRWWDNDWASWITFSSKTRMVEFQAGPKGWSSRSADFPRYAVDYTTLGNEDFYGPMSRRESPRTAVAWTDPNPGNVHIRIHQPTCPGGWTSGCNAVIHEVQFDTDSQWKDGSLVDGP